MILSVCKKIGPERPTCPLRRGIYAGDRPELKGKTALISRCTGGWKVQVDDRSSEYAFGWWKFPYKDWTTA